jgi:transcription antitermination factor NusG
MMSDECKGTTAFIFIIHHSAFIISKLMSNEPQKFLGWGPKRRRGPQTFRLGDNVRVLAGPFAAFTGGIEGINQVKRLLKVRVEIFGRETPIKLGFADAEKVSFS